MNQSKLFLRDIFDDLVERKLWPVALILLVALIAIPVLVAKPASSPAPVSTTAATTPAVGSGSPLSAFEPVVSATETSAERKALRGREKNPFTAKGINFAAAKSEGNASPIAGVSGAQVATGGGTGATAPGTTQSPQTTTQHDSQKTTFYTYTAKVGFGDEGDPKTRTLAQFRALPSSDNPVAIFMGVKKDGKTAVFLLSSSTTTTGDGDCQPTDTNCTFLYMKAGDSQIIETVTSDGEIATYELDLISIDAEPVKAPDSAKSSESPSALDSAGDPARRAARARARSAMHVFTRLPF
jgi:hypothetical protein